MTGSIYEGNDTYQRTDDIVRASKTLTGRIEKFLGPDGDSAFDSMGVFAERRVSPALPMNFFGNQLGSQSNTANTWCHKLSVPAQFDGIQIVISHNAATTPTIKGIAAVTETAAVDTAANMFEPYTGGVSYNTAVDTDAYGWQTIKWAGASTKQFAGTGTQFSPEVVVSDIIPLSSLARTDGGTDPLLMFRIYCDGAAATLCFMSSAASLRSEGGTNGKQIMQVSSRNTDGVATPASYPAALGTLSLSVGIVAYARNRGVGVMTIGDSITSNDAQVIDKVSAWGLRGVNAISTQSKPFSIVNFGCSGQNSLTYHANGLAALPKWGVNAAVYSAWTPNDYSTPSAAALRLAVVKMGARLQAFLSYCYANRIVPIVTTGIPHSAASGLTTAALDNQRKAYNDKLRAMAAQNYFIICDFDSALSDGASPAAIRPIYAQGDGVHPSDSGVAAMATVFTSTLARVPC